MLSYISGSLHNGVNTLQTAVYTIRPTSVNCGENTSFTLTVYVNPKPEVTPMSTVVCSGLTFQVSPSDMRDGIVPVGSSYTWEIPSVSTASLVGGQSGSGLFVTGNLTNNTNTTRTAVYTVTPTAPAPGSCVGATFTVVVYVDPKAVITEMSTTICSGASFEVSPTDIKNGIVPANT